MPLIQAVSHVRVFVRPGQWAATRSFYQKILGLKTIDPENGVHELPGGMTLGIERVHAKDQEGDLVGRLLAVSFRTPNTKTQRHGGVVFPH